MDSILTTVKMMNGIVEEYNHFDPQLIVHINTVLMTLTQIGVGPAEGFYIEDDSTTWDEYLVDPMKLQAVKTYIALRVKLLFDPPSSSSLIESYKRQIDELEWRIRLDAETTDTE